MAAGGGGGDLPEWDLSGDYAKPWLDRVEDWLSHRGREDLSDTDLSELAYSLTHLVLPGGGARQDLFDRVTRILWSLQNKLFGDAVSIERSLSATALLSRAMFHPTAVASTFASRMDSSESLFFKAVSSFLNHLTPPREWPLTQHSIIKGLTHLGSFNNNGLLVRSGIVDSVLDILALEADAARGDVLSEVIIRIANARGFMVWPGDHLIGGLVPNVLSLLYDDSVTPPFIILDLLIGLDDVDDAYFREMVSDDRFSGVIEVAKTVLEDDTISGHHKSRVLSFLEKLVTDPEYSADVKIRLDVSASGLTGLLVSLLANPLNRELSSQYLRVLVNLIAAGIGLEKESLSLLTPDVLTEVLKSPNRFNTCRLFSYLLQVDFERTAAYLEERMILEDLDPAVEEGLVHLSINLSENLAQFEMQLEAMFWIIDMPTLGEDAEIDVESRLGWLTRAARHAVRTPDRLDLRILVGRVVDLLLRMEREDLARGVFDDLKKSFRGLSASLQRGGRDPELPFLLRRQMPLIPILEAFGDYSGHPILFVAALTGPQHAEISARFRMALSYKTPDGRAEMEIRKLLALPYDFYRDFKALAVDVGRGVAYRLDRLFNVSSKEGETLLTRVSGSAKGEKLWLAEEEGMRLILMQLTPEQKQEIFYSLLQTPGAVSLSLFLITEPAWLGYLLDGEVPVAVREEITQFTEENHDLVFSVIDAKHGASLFSIASEDARDRLPAVSAWLRELALLAKAECKSRPVHWASCALAFGMVGDSIYHHGAGYGGPDPIPAEGAAGPARTGLGPRSRVRVLRRDPRSAGPDEYGASGAGSAGAGAGWGGP